MRGEGNVPKYLTELAMEQLKSRITTLEQNKITLEQRIAALEQERDALHKGEWEAQPHRPAPRNRWDRGNE